jgi:uncharacterized SAM-binding protein YcdF (DUF218 family)
MIDALWLKALAKALVLPPTGPLLMAGLGIALLRRVPRLGRLLATGGVATLLVLAMPAVAEFLVGFVDNSAPFDLQAAKKAKALVILGGGIRHNAPEYGGDTLATLTLERVRYGAYVAGITGLPVLVSGGTVLAGEPEANLMAGALEREFGVPVRWVEPLSRTTHENAVHTAAMLKREGIDRIVLVTHVFDTRRATAEFEAQGLAVVIAPTGGSSAGEGSILDWVPSMVGLTRSYYATYELLANLVRVLSPGR